MGIFYENNNEKIKEILDKKICFLFLCELMNFLSGPVEAGGRGWQLLPLPSRFLKILKSVLLS